VGVEVVNEAPSDDVTHTQGKEGRHYRLSLP
jgi:hypothetical protein